MRRDLYQEQNSLRRGPFTPNGKTRACVLELSDDVLGPGKRGAKVTWWDNFRVTMVPEARLEDVADEQVRATRR